MRRLYSFLVTFMVIGAIFVSAAAADTTSSQPSCTTASNGNVTCIQQTGVQVGQATDHESASFKASANGKSKIVYLVSEHFVSYAQMKRAQANGSCRWFKKVWNSGFKDGTGALGWRIDHHVYGCLINGKWYKFGGGMTGEACGNLLRLISSPPPPSEVYENARFVAHMMWKAIVHLKATSHATVSVKVSVHNTDFSCVSSASGQSSSTGFAFASASATATSKATARAEAQGKAAKLTGYTNQQASVNATASAKTSATAQASAKASCSPTTPPPPPPPPATCQDVHALNYGGPPPCQYPPTSTPTPPTVTSVLSVQEMDTTSPNATSEEPVTATVSAPNGDTLKVVYSACYGSFPNGNTASTTSTSSPFTYSDVYEAPTEVPPGTACAGVPAGYDRITVYVYDLTTGLDNTTQSDGKNTTLVQIIQPVANPS